MDAEQKVFTFHASGLKPILDQEGTFPASEIVWLGKCLVLTTLCPHPGIVQGHHHRGAPETPQLLNLFTNHVLHILLRPPLQT